VLSVERSRLPEPARQSGSYLADEIDQLRTQRQLHRRFGRARGGASAGGNNGGLRAVAVSSNSDATAGLNH